MKHKKVFENGRYVPLRTCVACRAVRPKKDMVRVVKSNGGIVLADKAQNRDGRGAYICKDKSCMEKAQKIRGLERGLKCAVSADLYRECADDI